MTHGSLFSGIGGFDLAAEWMGWENVFHCEWNEFGKRVLKYYWPEAESFNDITKTDFTKYANKIDILSGGFPCQPYSMAGKRLGKNDERHLWPEMCRAIKEIAPRYVVGENVRGLTNWNGGLVFDEVCTDLENLGYQVAPYLIPASATNAPHKRERIWFIAYRNCAGLEASRTAFKAAGVKQHGELDYNATDTESSGIPSSVDQRRESQPQNGTKIRPRFGTNGKERNASHTDRDGFEQRDGKYEIEPSKNGINALDDPDENDERGNVTNANGSGIQGHGGRGKNGKFQANEFNQNNRKRQPRMDWENFPTQSPICGGNDGLPSELDGITFSKWRAESIKAYGNAVVPQVVYEIFKAIENYESL